MKPLPILLVVVNLTLAPAMAHADQSVRQGPDIVNPEEAGIGRRVSDVEFRDIHDRSHKLSSLKGHKAIAISMTSTACPLSRKFLPQLARLGDELRAMGVQLILVNPMGNEDRSAMAAAALELGDAVLYIPDPHQSLARALGASTTTEVVLLDTARTLLYRGALNDQYGLGYALEEARTHYLSDAVGDYLTGQPIRIPATTAPGCELGLQTFASNREPVTYHNRISRIMQNHCVECHREGGVAPFSLDNYDDVKGHAAMIRRVVERGIMPPWFASTTDGNTHSPWANDRTLPARDKSDLLAWLQSEKDIGDPTESPVARRFPDEWAIGTPDAVLQLPRPIAVKAEGVMEYQYVDVPTDFATDKWVRALEVQPTARQVVHHVLVFIIPRDATSAQQRRAESDGFFAAYVPGNSTIVYPERFAKHLPVGATLRFQIHYTPNGQAAEDQTRLGLVFAEAAPQHEVLTSGIANTRIMIPPGAADHREVAAIRMPLDVHALAFFPHMHVRGKAIRYEAVTAGGETQVLLDVPRYDFNWQLSYRLRNPIPIQRGTRLQVIGWFDNSLGNPANPDPTRTVRWGPQTHDEMLLGYVEYYVTEPAVSSN